MNEKLLGEVKRLAQRQLSRYESFGPSGLDPDTVELLCKKALDLVSDLEPPVKVVNDYPTLVVRR